MKAEKAPGIVREEKKASYKMKDEMNFAEAGGLIFASNPADVKTVSHEEKRIDFSKGKRSAKKITITASDNCRLPLPSDAKVFVALISLTAPGDFKKQKVYFTLLELLKILGWAPDGRNYERLKAALTRLRSVRFIFENTWYSNGDKSYTSEDFNILDSLKIVDNQKRGRRSNDKDKCFFKWSDTLYRSFKENNVKDIDLHYLQTLSDLAFSVYRFLDKAFYFRSRLEYDMESFAEQMGVKRTKANNLTKIKGRLSRVFKELEDVGFLQPMTQTERFLMKKRGEWQLVILKAGAKALLKADSKELSRLILHGVKRQQAVQITETHDIKHINKMLEYFEKVVLAKGETKIRSKGAWLNSAFSNKDFAFPANFESAVEKKERALRLKEERIKNAQKERTTLVKEVEKTSIETLKYKKYWDALSAIEKEELELRAVAAASSTHRKLYERNKDKQSASWRAIRQHLISQQIDKDLEDPFSF